MGLTEEDLNFNLPRFGLSPCWHTRPRNMFTHPPTSTLTIWTGLEWNRIVIINSLSWAPCSFCIFIPSGKLLIHQFTPFCLQLFLYMFVIVQRMMMMVMIDGRFCCVQSN